MAKFLLTRLRRKSMLERVFRERLSEPLHLNAISLGVMLFGSFRTKVYFDTVIRQQHAYALLTAADRAKKFGFDCVTAIEFGVANGSGLLNICEIAQRVTDTTGVRFKILGFDSGKGMPEPIDYRDHPEFYQPGWYPMQSQDGLRAALPENASLVVGSIAETLPRFAGQINPAEPIGFVSIDVDYYSSAMESLKVFDGPAENHLPIVEIYADDVQNPGHNRWAGELLAFDEFNQAHPLRKIDRTNFLRERRLFKNASWISHMHSLHVLDHPARSSLLRDHDQVVINNAYLGL